jgi:hypothetical protein
MDLVSPRGFPYSLFDASERRPTNWHGRPIDPSARSAVVVGNQVRVQIEGPADRAYLVAMYFRVLQVTGDRLLGVCDDPNYGEDPNFPFLNGDQLEFERKNIVEIPTGWPSNGNLSHFKATSALSLFPTGPLGRKSVFEELGVDVPPLETIATIEAVAANPDYLVRWLLLDCLTAESPARPEQAERWAEVDRVLERFAQDGSAALREYATFLIEDRRLNLIIWQRRGTDRKDPELKQLKKAMKTHRKRKFPALLDLIWEFKARGDSDLRAELDRYLAERLAQPR